MLLNDLDIVKISSKRLETNFVSTIPANLASDIIDPKFEEYF